MMIARANHTFITTHHQHILTITSIPCPQQCCCPQATSALSLLTKSMNCPCSCTAVIVYLQQDTCKLIWTAPQRTPYIQYERAVKLLKFLQKISTTRLYLPNAITVLQVMHTERHQRCAASCVATAHPLFYDSCKPLLTATGRASQSHQLPLQPLVLLIDLGGRSN